MALDFTLLTEEQIWSTGALDVMKGYGTKVAQTDLAVILGGEVSADGHKTPEGELSCNSLTRSAIGPVWVVRAVCADGAIGGAYPQRRYVSIRPVLPPSETANLIPSNLKTGVNNVDIVEYGEYPQAVADEKTSNKLEKLYQSNSLNQTGKNYTFDQNTTAWPVTAFQPLICPEYRLKTKKYIRVLGCPYDKSSKLSTGKQVKEEKPYWIQVQPIEWLKDPMGTWVSKKCLLAGIQFDTKEQYRGYFSKTFLKHYLDTYFAKEVEPSVLEVDKEVMKSLRAKLAEAMDLEQVKKGLRPARTPERLEEAARITRIRRVRGILVGAATEAHAEGNEATLQAIIKEARPYEMRAQALQNRFDLRRAEHRAKRDRE